MGPCQAHARSGAFLGPQAGRSPPDKGRCSREGSKCMFAGFPKEAALPSPSPEAVSLDLTPSHLCLCLSLSWSPSVSLSNEEAESRQASLAPPSSHTSPNQASVVYSRSRGSRAASSASRLQSLGIFLREQEHQGKERERMRAQESRRS